MASAAYCKLPVQIFYMKQTGLFLFVLILQTTGWGQQTRFVLRGDLTGINMPIEKVYLNYLVNDQRITDSVLVKQGVFGFSGNLTGPLQAGLRVKYKSDPASKTTLPFNSKRDYVLLFLEPGIISVKSLDSFSNITVTGSKSDIEYRKLELKAVPFNTLLDGLYNSYTAARKRNDTASMQELEKQIDDANAEANEKIYADYVKKNPESPLALYALKNWAGYDIDPTKISPVFDGLPIVVRNSEEGKAFSEKIVIAKKTAIGEKAIDFTQNDTVGKPVSLSAYKGKYVLVDFWASWCGPCRMENPAIVKAFEKYHDKGFQILAVSLDRPGGKDKWLKAIHDDGLRWTHVSDLGFWDNAVAKQYGIQAIPQNLLLNPEGKIIAKNLNGADLQKKLATIYSN